MATSTPIRPVNLHERLVPTALLIGLLSLLSLSAVGQVICRLHSGASYFYYQENDLQMIIDNATAGDTIILPGGPLFVPSGIDVWKPLVFIGAGYHPNGTEVTDITKVVQPTSGGFGLAAGAGGSSFHGIEFEIPFGFASNFSGAHFSRCKFADINVGPGSGTAASDLHFLQCVFTEGLNQPNGTGPQGLYLDNCIIDGSIDLNDGVSTAWVTNCILLDPNVSTTSVNEGLTYLRCIFTKTSGGWGVGDKARYSNCAFGKVEGPYGGPPSFSNEAVDLGGNIQVNLLSQPPLFVGAVSLVNYDDDSVFDLNHPGAADDIDQMFDAGVYDGVSGNAWKPNSIPFNPHWTALPTSFGTTNGGLLNSVNIGGSAQQD